MKKIKFGDEKIEVRNCFTDRKNYLLILEGKSSKCFRKCEKSVLGYLDETNSTLHQFFDLNYVSSKELLKCSIIDTFGFFRVLSFWNSEALGLSACSMIVRVGNFSIASDVFSSATRLSACVLVSLLDDFGLLKLHGSDLLLFFLELSVD